MPVFTITFCAIIFVIYLLDNFILIPKTEKAQAETPEPIILIAHGFTMFYSSVHIIL